MTVLDQIIDKKEQEVRNALNDYKEKLVELRHLIEIKGVLKDENKK